MVKVIFNVKHVWFPSSKHFCIYWVHKEGWRVGKYKLIIRTSGSPRGPEPQSSLWKKYPSVNFSRLVISLSLFIWPASKKFSSAVMRLPCIWQASGSNLSRGTACSERSYPHSSCLLIRNDATSWTPLNLPIHCYGISPDTLHKSNHKQTPIQWIPRVLSLGVKRSGREADHSPPSCAEVKKWVKLYLHSPNTPSWRGAQLKHN
jgi:hypothetical protein